MKKNRPDKLGIVFSTNPDFKFQPEEAEPLEEVLPGKQSLRILLDKKQRKGKGQYFLVEEEKFK